MRMGNGLTATAMRMGIVILFAITMLARLCVASSPILRMRSVCPLLQLMHALPHPPIPLTRLLSSCRCCDQGQSEQAVGVALESRRLDKLEEVIGRSSDAVKAIKYSLRACQKLVINRSFRQQVCRFV